MKTEKQIPKIPASVSNGWISEQRVRCGKPNCRCSRGGHPHTGYYFFTRVNGKLIKRYLPRLAVAEMRRAIERCRARRATSRESARNSLVQWRKLRDLARRHDSHILTLKEHQQK